MNVSNEMLDLLCARERYREILEELGPQATAVVALLVEDELSAAGVAELLGITRSAASMRLSLARGRIMARFPELERYYGFHGIPVGRCQVCGKVIARGSTCCRKCCQKFKDS